MDLNWKFLEEEILMAMEYSSRIFNNLRYKVNENQNTLNLILPQAEWLRQKDKIKG